MISFRKKIALGHIALFVLFILIAVSFIDKAVSKIVLNNLLEDSRYLMDVLKGQPNESQMLRQLKNSQGYFFFGVSLFNGQGVMLYDSSVGEIGEEQRIASMPLSPSEVSETVQKGTVFSTGESPVSKHKLAYVRLAFDLNAKTYILRTAIPLLQLQDFTEEFRVWFFVFCAMALVFFGAVAWLLFHRINFPIRQIIRAIGPYQRGEQEEIAKIVLGPSIDAKDDFYRLAETLNSLTERLRQQIKSIKGERNEKEAILESLGEGVIAVDAQMYLLYINAVGAKMLGVSKLKALGKPFLEIPAANATLLKKCGSLLEACQERRTALTDSILIEDGKRVYLDLIAAPKAQASGAILVLQDKSSHYKVLEMGKDFVANASHELRTPITIIKGFAETLQDMPELPRDMVVDITEKIVRNCQRMDTLVKNLLTLADLENLPDSRFRDCDLIPLVEMCRQVVLSVYEDAQIFIEKSHESIVIAADPDILELAILNLLDNAAKYSNPPAQITLRLVQGMDEVEISISDKGIGISPADQEHIFERFYTVDKARSRRFGGAGLGLSIVRTIIERHYGTISVSSTPGKGTTFLIRLPIRH